MNESLPLFHAAFLKLLESGSSCLSGIGKTEAIPRFEGDSIKELCNKTISILSHQPTLLKLHSPIVVVGDLHGSLQDLVRIFNNTSPPPKTKYLFLGDYVDRGPFSLEVLLMLFTYLCLYPECIYLIRGNHEFSIVCSEYSFKEEVVAAYNMEIYNKLLEVFSFIPLACVLDHFIFCVHGGISPELENVEIISNIRRPIPTAGSLVENLVWSDPVYTGFTGYGLSPRGKGLTFGPSAIKYFYEKTNMRCIIRGHQVIDTGIEMQGEYSVITVFSASAYEDNPIQKSGALKVYPDFKFEALTFGRFQQIKRETAMFYDVELPKKPSKALSYSLLTPKRHYSSAVNVHIAVQPSGQRFKTIQTSTKIGFSSIATQQMKSKMPPRPRTKSRNSNE